MLPARRFPPFALTLLLALLTACGTTGTNEGSQSGGRNLITESELAELPELDALQAIERLRPRWLRQPLGRSPVPVLNGTPQRSASMSVLRSIRVADVRQMRYMSASDATTRYGTGFDGGAIIIETHRGGD